ncbi:hypothetical protein [Luteococcus peritonei]|uniref:Uncharacterized protein n=1 Tax=Luteococcus peritonei TaxID=88874 RepID=A0ABW4RWL4_9ACTN
MSPRPEPRALCLAMLLATLVAGCSSAPEASTNTTAPTPATTFSLPAGATTLREMMLVNGPSSLVLPGDVSTTSRIDQPNVVTLTFPVGQGEQLAEWLTSTLPANGWSVDAARETSMLFHDDDVDGEPWQGAFTCSRTSCALTLRNQ